LYNRYWLIYAYFYINDQFVVGIQFKIQNKMAITTALKDNLKEEMDRSIREQDILELRSQLDIIHSAMDKVNWNPIRTPRYKKVD